MVKKLKNFLFFGQFFQACCSFLSGAFIMLEKTKRSSLDLPNMVLKKNTPRGGYFFVAENSWFFRITLSP